MSDTDLLTERFARATDVADDGDWDDVLRRTATTGHTRRRFPQDGRVSRRVAALTVVLAMLGVGTAVAATNRWLNAEPAPQSVVDDFGSYTPQLGFDPEPGRAVRVAQDGEFILYATSNRQGTYCLLASAPWRRPRRDGEGGTCVAPADAAAPLIAGLVGARSHPTGTAHTYVIAGRVNDREARAIRFTGPDGGEIRRPIGAGGFFIAAVRTGDAACAAGDWHPRFTALDADGETRATRVIEIASARAADVCVFGAPHA